MSAVTSPIPRRITTSTRTTRTYKDELEKLRVHIDAIKPVWRADLKTEWFDSLDPNFRKLMHPYDVANPPSGHGWVIQIVCHHYNPYPSTTQMKIPTRQSRAGRIRPLPIHHGESPQEAQ